MNPQIIRGLLIEDNPDDADVLLELLSKEEQDKGSEAAPRIELVHTARLDRAFDELNQQEYDVALLDLNLPDSQGRDTFTRLHAHSPRLPVVIITGRTDQATEVQTMQSGAQDYLIKGQVDGKRIARAVRFAVERYKTKKNNNFLQQNETVLIEDNASHPPGYQTVRTLGSGSIAHVFLAERLNSSGENELCALKVLRLEDLPPSQSHKVKERFLQEAEILNQIDHPHIVRILDYGQLKNSDQPYIAMEYVEGASLRSWINSENKLDVGQKTQLLLQIASAIEEIHRRNIFHRDIKPENILVDQNMQVKLTDFGIARVPLSEATQSEQIVGTPAYMSPEAFKTAATDARSDIFSLGALAYELYLGQKAFNAESFPELIKQIQHLPPVEPRKIRSDFPHPLQGILARMLKKRPSQRYQKARQLMVDLENFLTKGTVGFKHFGHIHQVFTKDWR